MEQPCESGQSAEDGSDAVREPSEGFLNRSQNDPFKVNLMESLFKNQNSVKLDKHEDFVNKIFESMGNAPENPSEGSWLGQLNPDSGPKQSDFEKNREKIMGDSTRKQKIKVQGISFKSRNLARITKRKSLNCTGTMLKKHIGRDKGRAAQAGVESRWRGERNRSPLDAAQAQGTRNRAELGTAAQSDPRAPAKGGRTGAQDGQSQRSASVFGHFFDRLAI